MLISTYYDYLVNVLISAYIFTVCMIQCKFQMLLNMRNRYDKENDKYLNGILYEF